MAVAKTITAATTEAEVPQLIVVTNPRLAPKLVRLAKEGAELAKSQSATKKRLEVIKGIFLEHFEATKTTEGTNAVGVVMARQTFGNPNVLDQAELQRKYPKIAAECTHPRPWTSVAFA